MEEDDEKLKLVIGESKSRYEDTLICRAAHLFAKKEFQKSLVVWQKIESLRAHPKEARYEEIDGCARCFFHLEQYREAYEYVNRLVSLASNDAAAWLLRSQIELKLPSDLDPNVNQSNVVDDIGVVTVQVHNAVTSLLRSLLCPSPLLQAYISLAHLYRSFNSPLVVQFLVFRAHVHIRKSKRAEMYAAFLFELSELEKWFDGFVPREVVEIGIKSVFKQDSVVMELETRYFGEGFERVCQAASIPPSEEELPDIRDPSRM